MRSVPEWADSLSRSLAIYGMLLMLFLLASGGCADTVLGGDTVQEIRQSEKLAHATALYRDCEAVPKSDSKINLTRIEESWRTDFDTIKRYLREDNGAAIERALSLASMLTNGKFSTRTTAKEVMDLLDRTTIKAGNRTAAAYALSGYRIIITTGLIRHICDRLLPNDSFDELVREAKLAAQIVQLEEQRAAQSTARNKSASLAANFIVRSIQYTGLKLFVLGHEAAHVLLDPYSKEIVSAEGYQEKHKGCLETFYLETRSDIVGLSAVRQVSTADKIDAVLRPELATFPNRDIENMGKFAVHAGISDLFTIIEKETEWQPDPECAYGATQRRQQLEKALRKLESEEDDEKQKK